MSISETWKRRINSLVAAGIIPSNLLSLLQNMANICL